jgi:membrane protein DedA with SNARE-associated domain
MEHLIEIIVTWTLDVIETFGYYGIFFTQTLESIAFPIPSEIVLPFSGYLATTGTFSFWSVVIVATLANLLGSIIGYYIGATGGRYLLEKYGKYILISSDSIAKMDSLLQRRGELVAFIARMLPGIRTFSSIIIGSGKMRYSVFFWYTILGSFIWNLGLAYVGYKVGEEWNILQPYFHKIEIVIGVAIIGFVAWYVYTNVRKRRLNQI